MWDKNTLEDEVQKNSLEYGVAVVTDRALPDAKSGLKPVNRRAIYDMFDSGVLSNTPHKKSARIVGDTMGKFHPHGDSSIYLAIVRMAQPWVMRYPLIDSHGNFGNILGDGPAAQRYTEVRLSKIAEKGLLQGLKKKNVDFIPTYDEDDVEPITFPAVFPNLLCNPNDGIAWAMACNWAPHNLGEVAEAINMRLDGKTPMLPGPDFPTGGIVINGKDIPAIMKTGHGSVKIRGRYKVEKQNIVFYEIPYGTRVEALMEQISNAYDAGSVGNIAGIRNETGKDSDGNVRLIIEVEAGANPEVVVRQLFAKTDLQTSFSYNQVALVNKVPVELNLEGAIDVYVEHNIECIKREAEFDKKKAADRLHIVEGLLKALTDIDNIIKLIKGSASAAAAKEELIKIYSFSEEQAKAILDMKLSKLANLEKVELEKEKADLETTVKELTALLNDRNLQVEELKKRLAEIVRLFGDARRTEITNIEEPKTKIEKETVEVIPEDVVVVTTQSGYIKRVPTTAFKVQHRNTKGIKSMDEVAMDMVKTNTADIMVYFSDKGKMYRSVVDKIPAADNKSKGSYIGDIIKLDADEKIVAVSSLKRTSVPKYIIFITKNGMIKKSLLEEYFKTNRNTGIQALNLADDDTVVDIIFQDDEDLVVLTKQGMAIKFKSSLVNATGRATMGVKAIKLNEGDEVIAGLPVHKETDTIGIFTIDGLGKRVELSELTIQGRGGKGVQIYPKGNEVVGALMLSEDDNVLVSGSTSGVAISAAEIPVQGKPAAGVAIIKKSNVKSVTKI